MIRSMTGIGCVSAVSRNTAWTVEIRSINHRYFEFNLRASSQVAALEEPIRQLLKETVSRGKVTVSIEEGRKTPGEQLVFNDSVAAFYVSVIRKIRRRYPIEGPISMGEFLRLPNLFSTEKRPEKSGELWPSLKPVLVRAIARFSESQRKEGAALQRKFVDHFRRVENSLNRIKKYADRRPGRYFERLSKNANRMVQETDPGRKIDPLRLQEEIVILSQKVDITEEVVRLKHHLETACQAVHRGGAVGRQLDFLLQEINREANTMGAKAQDMGISREVVSIKVELEKIREQVQNIE